MGNRQSDLPRMGGSTGWYMVSAHPLREKECVFDPPALFDWKREARCVIIADNQISEWRCRLCATKRHWRRFLNFHSEQIGFFRLSQLFRFPRNPAAARATACLLCKPEALPLKRRLSWVQRKDDPTDERFSGIYPSRARRKVLHGAGKQI